MQSVRFVYWQEDGWWLGHLEEFPDYWTQGGTLEELRESLEEIYRDLTSGAIPNVLFRSRATLIAASRPVRSSANDLVTADGRSAELINDPLNRAPEFVGRRKSVRRFASHGLGGDAVELLDLVAEFP